MAIEKNFFRQVMGVVFVCFPLGRKHFADLGNVSRPAICENWVAFVLQSANQTLNRALPVCWH